MFGLLTCILYTIKQSIVQTKGFFLLIIIKKLTFSDLKIVGKTTFITMLEEAFQLLLVLATIVITLLDPVLQFTNGVDLFMEATTTSPLEVIYRKCIFGI